MDKTDNMPDTTDAYMYLRDILEDTSPKDILNKPGVLEALIPLFQDEIQALHKEATEGLE